MSTEDSKLPKILYHYTTMEGFLGIINSKTFRATNIFYLNDSTEYMYAREIMQEEIELFLNELPPPPPRPAITRGGLLGMQMFPESIPEGDKPEEDMPIANIRHFLELTRFMLEFRHTQIYVCSFTEEGDQLSQWRGYCPQGNCFSLGFDTETLIDLMKKNSFHLVKCLYERSYQKETVKDILSENIRHVEAIKPGLGEDERKKKVNEISNIAMGELIQTMPEFKHETFKEEKEWRFVRVLTSKEEIRRVNFRAGKSMIVPYYNVEIDNSYTSALTYVIVGPTPHMELARMSAGSLVANKWERKCEIMTSTSPFRSW